jgi:hypothetical protein
MRIGMLTGVAAIALLGACQQQAPQHPSNQGAGIPEPEGTPSPLPANASAPKSPLRDWLIGTWSFEQTCQTDFIVHYNADGTLDNFGHIGTWTVEGERVTEKISERPDEGGEGSVKVDPPEANVYTVMRTDADNGVIRYQGRSVPIRRC